MPEENARSGLEALRRLAVRRAFEEIQKENAERAEKAPASAPSEKLTSATLDDLERKFDDGSLTFAFPLERARPIPLETPAPKPLKKDPAPIKKVIAPKAAPEPVAAKETPIAITVVAPVLEKAIIGQSRYFMRAKDHDWLHKLGESLKADIKKGKRLFGIMGVDGTPTSRMMLGLGSWAGYHLHCNVLLVAGDALAGQLHGLLLVDGAPVKGQTFATVAYDNVHIMRQEDYLAVLAAGRAQELQANYGLCLLDLPTLQELKAARQRLHALVEGLAGLYVLFSTKKISYRQMEKLVSYFTNYGVPLKGAFKGG